MIRKTITVTAQQNDWIKAEMAQGGYGNESELIRDLIRNRQREQQTQRETPEELALIREKLAAAKKSGVAADFDKNDFLKEIKAQLSNNGSI